MTRPNTTDTAIYAGHGVSKVATAPGGGKGPQGRLNWPDYVSQENFVSVVKEQAANHEKNMHLGYSQRADAAVQYLQGKGFQNKTDWTDLASTGAWNS